MQPNLRVIRSRVRNDDTFVGSIGFNHARSICPIVRECLCPSTGFGLLSQLASLVLGSMTGIERDAVYTDDAALRRWIPKG